MPPKQANIGKFFGNPSGSKPAAAQQSKLKFSTKADDASSKSKKDTGTKAAARESANLNGNTKNEEHVSDEDVKMEDASGAGQSSGDIDAHDKPTAASASPTPSKKRQSVDSNGEAESDDEPPSKRQRVRKTKTGQQDSAVGDRSDNDVLATEPPAKPKKSPTPKGSPEQGRTDKGKTNLGKVESTKPSHKSLKSRKPKDGPEAEPKDEELEDSKAIAPEETKSDSESLEAESEDEKPEVAAKSREKVQATLTGKSKDLYPDWKAGDAVPYAALCTTFSKIEMTTKRLEITALCSQFLVQVLRLTPDDLLSTVLLMVNKLAADYAGIELGIGESLIMKAIGETTGRSLQIIKADQQEIGDLGLVAAKSRSNQPTMFKPKPLTVRGVHEGLMGIATTEGQGAQGRKVGGIKKLLSAADAQFAGKGSKGIDITKDKGGPSECKFIIRTLEGKMRLGLAEKTVLVALAHAMVVHEKSKAGKTASSEDLSKGETMLKSVYNELPSYEVIVPALINHGIFNLRDNCNLQPGVPLKPMLAKPTKSITEVLDRFEGHEFSCEYKYDGERAQIHFTAHDASQEYASAAPSAGKTEKGISNIFSRNSEDLSKKYPDILEKLPTWVKDGTKSFVLDCEAVAWDMVEKKVLPFQQLMTRKRKDVKVEDIKVKVCVFAFDLLYLNGEALVNKPFRERRDLMERAFTEVEGEFAFAKYGNTNELEQIQTLLEDSVKASCEGLMVKMLDGVSSYYEPSRRSQNWLKVKKDYLSGAGDSLDLVVLGAYYGRGKRTSVYGAFLLACYNESTEKYESVCNIGTGFSEAILEEFHTQLSPIVIDKPKPFYSHSTGNKDQPDVWFEPRYVWEVRNADFTASPKYRAAAGEDQLISADPKAEGKGVSLRFPRFLKVRDDKKPEEATTSTAVAEMYAKQEGVAKNKGPSVDDDFEY
ncbi:MAG: hypothetical protein M1831_005839 [Alyxoria varia]|nr:MAG: hypothetical protein M1831_005839 [Alyxoria varia]